MLSGGDAVERLLPGHRAGPLADGRAVDLEDQQAASGGRGHLPPEGEFAGRHSVRVTLSVLLLAGPIAPDCAAKLPAWTTLCWTVQLAGAAARRDDNCQGNALKLPVSKPSKSATATLLRCQAVACPWRAASRWPHCPPGLRSVPPLSPKRGGRAIIQVGCSLSGRHGIGEGERRSAAAAGVVGHSAVIKRQFRHAADVDRSVEGDRDRNRLARRVARVGCRRRRDCAESRPAFQTRRPPLGWCRR